MSIKCATCGRQIDNIEYIVESAYSVDKTIEEYVRHSDLVDDNNEFICNDCYLEIGLPSLPINELLMWAPNTNNKFVDMCKEIYNRGEH